MDNIFGWSVANEMTFDISNCRIITFTWARQYMKSIYFLNGVLIDRINGIWVSVWPLLCFFTLIMLYYSFVWSKLESSATIWNQVHLIYRDVIREIPEKVFEISVLQIFYVYTYEIPYDQLLVLFGLRRVNLKMLMGLVFLCKMVCSEGSDGLSFRVHSFRSRGKLLFALPYCCTYIHASFRLPAFESI